MTKRLIFGVLAGFLAWTGADSTVKADPIFVEVQTAPPAVESYPHTVYRGEPVYYVEGRWYYRHGPRWAYYREEPRPLIEFRSSPAYVHHHRHDHHHYVRREVHEHHHRGRHRH